ncbi:hypothetical protein DFJ43DRAFT_431550 [Lentinula guzmanii]|uniref:Uncharacterized protein n=1 Tax=Lentinula guzmanii TaxID=2804957 RepID=A0AA38J7V0_9AGAR|nr:hypothetical protein DFJ43DRAFT_431550 [Lentinula guzmanii]
MVYSRSIVVAIIAASAISALAAPVPDGAGGKHSQGTTFQKGNSTGSGDMQQNKGPKHGHGHGHGHRHGHKHNDTMSVVPPDTTGTSSPLIEAGGRKERKKGGNNKRGGPESERSSGKHEDKEHGESKPTDPT